MNPKISAGVIIRNEERLLARCLESIKDLADEIIVIHDGECTDNSLNIARKYTDKIFVREKFGSCEFHRIFFFEKAMYEWVLNIDADEYFRKEDSPKIKKLVSDGTVDAYSFIWELWNGKQYLTHGFPKKTVLYRKNKLYFIRFHDFHCQTYGRIEETNIKLMHEPEYNNYSVEAFKTKWLRWTRIQAKSLISVIENPETLKVYNTDEEVKQKFLRKLSLEKKFAKNYLIPLWFVVGFTQWLFRYKAYLSLFGYKVAFLKGLQASFLCYYINKYASDKYAGHTTPKKS